MRKNISKMIVSLLVGVSLVFIVVPTSQLEVRVDIANKCWYRVPVMK